MHVCVSILSLYLSLHECHILAKHPPHTHTQIDVPGCHILLWYPEIHESLSLIPQLFLTELCMDSSAKVVTMIGFLFFLDYKELPICPEK